MSVAAHAHDPVGPLQPQILQTPVPSRQRQSGGPRTIFARRRSFWLAGTVRRQADRETLCGSPDRSVNITQNGLCLPESGWTEADESIEADPSRFGSAKEMYREIDIGKEHVVRVFARNETVGSVDKLQKTRHGWICLSRDERVSRANPAPSATRSGIRFLTDLERTNEAPAPERRKCPGAHGVGRWERHPLSTFYFSGI